MYDGLIISITRIIGFTALRMKDWRVLLFCPWVRQDGKEE